MNFKDLRDYIDFLERKGDLHRIKSPVSWDLEITEIADRVVKAGDRPCYSKTLTATTCRW